jgi:hypothetical protein
MGVDLQRRDDAGMAEPFLDKFPVYSFTTLQVGASQGGCVCF